MTKQVTRDLTPSPPGHPGGIALSDSEKTEAVLENLESYFQRMTDPSVPAVIEMAEVALRSYFLTPASEHKLTIPDEVQETMRGLKVGKGSGLKRYTEQGIEASFPASGIPPGPDL
jgi:hypothetical protein